MNPALVQPVVIPDPPGNIWTVTNVEFRDSNQITIWNSLRAAAENFDAATDDIQAASDAQAAGPVNPWIAPASSCINYFARAMRALYATRARTRGDRAQERARIAALGALDSLAAKVTLLTGMAGIDVPMSFANYDIAELVIHAKYFSMPAAARPSTLAALQTMLQQTNLFAVCSTRTVSQFWNTGMPAVAFICLGVAAVPAIHAELRVGCSKSKWDNFQRLQSPSFYWRDRRFVDPNRKQHIYNAGRTVKSTFETVQNLATVQQEHTDARRDNPNPGTRPASIVNYNLIIQRVWNTLHGAGVPYSFDHSNEIGGSFAASGRNIFTPVARCWKCRFVHLYNVNNAAVDNPFTVKFAAYKEEACAEDLCHYFCTIPAVQPPLPPFPPIPAALNPAMPATAVRSLAV